MKVLIAIVGLIALCGASAAAEEPAAGAPAAGAPAAAESLGLRIDQAGELRLGDLTVADLTRALDLLSVASRQREHIERSVKLSRAVPGLGHYINGDRGAALAFATADFAVGVFTVVFASLLLPPAVRTGNLNYLQSSFGVIEERWKGLSPSQLIPSAAVVLSGALLSATVRSLAAESARSVAVEALHDGRIVFAPEPLGGFDR